MRCLDKILSIFSVLYLISSVLSVWPLPFKFDKTQNGVTCFLSKNNFNIVVLQGQDQSLVQNLDKNPVLLKSLNKFQEKLFSPWIWKPSSHAQLPYGIATNCSLSKMVISITNFSEVLSIMSYNFDESYSLSVGIQDPIIINSYSVWGALKALESFSQLVLLRLPYSIQTDILPSTTLRDVYYILKDLPLSIQDSPRFRWRGLNIDVSYRYLEPSTTLKRVIDVMSLTKMNVLNIRWTGVSSFPLKLSQSYNVLGSFDPIAAIYTQAMIRDLVDYGRFLGIHVISTIDLFGSVKSWAKAFQNVNILASCPKFAAESVTLNPLSGNIYSNAVKQSYSFLTSLYNNSNTNEIEVESPNAFIGIGGNNGDFLPCWLADASIVNYLTNQNQSVLSLFKQFHEVLFSNIPSQQKSFIIGNELHQLQMAAGIDNGNLNGRDLIVEFQKHSALELALSGLVDKLLTTPIASKHNFLFSGTNWHLDSPLDNNNQAFLGPRSTWQEMLDVDPYSFLNSSSLRSQLDMQMLGGSAVLHGIETDDLNIDSILWPKVAVVAQRLWSKNLAGSSEPIIQENLDGFICNVFVRQKVRSLRVLQAEFCPFDQQNSQTCAGDNVNIDPSWYLIISLATCSILIIILMGTYFGIAHSFYKSVKVKRQQQLDSSYFQDVSKQLDEEMELPIMMDNGLQINEQQPQQENPIDEGDYAQKDTG